MHICQRSGLHLDPQLFLDKSTIPLVKETKFLGVIFDRLCFVPHVKNKGLKAHKLLAVLNWELTKMPYVDAHEVDEPSFCARRATLSLQYASKMKSLPSIPRMTRCLSQIYEVVCCKVECHPYSGVTIHAIGF